MNFKDNIGKTLQIKHVFEKKIKTAEVIEVFKAISREYVKLRFEKADKITTWSLEEWEIIGLVENLFGNNIMVIPDHKQ